MKKKQRKAQILLMSILLIYWIGKTFWLSLIFNDITLFSLENKFSPIHFTAPGNNFVGGIFWLPTKSISATTIQLGSHTKTCTKQVRGLYFNSQRGKRLWPLDSETLQLLRNQNSWYNNLELTWWLFTTCDSGNNYGIFGAITYTHGNTVSHVVAGTKMSRNTNKILAAMSNSFQYFDNKVPIGYLYDSYGWIGYVGGVLSGHEELLTYLSGGWSIQNGFRYSWTNIISNNPWRTTTIESGSAAMETMRNLIIQWSVGLSKTIKDEETISLLGNVNEKTVIYNSSDINSSTTINATKQKAQQFCRGKELYTTNTLEPYWEKIVCVENQNLTIDLGSTHYANKTIIVKNGNVILQNGMTENSPALELFVDKWIVYLPNTITAIWFNQKWFPGTPATHSWLYLKGNFIINGLIVGWTFPVPSTFPHKLHIQGRIVVLNTPMLPTTGRKEQIAGTIGSGYDNRINLQNIFVRTCGLNGIGSDGSSCNGTNTIATTPLVVLNGNYPSILLQ